MLAAVIAGFAGPAMANGDPTLSIDEVAMAEGNSGTTTFTFTVSLSAPAGAGGVVFDVATAENTATIADLDFVGKSLAGQAIATGNSSYTFDVTVNGDVLAEPNETFFVNVTNVIGATVGDGQGLGTITNDDGPGPVTVTVNQASGQADPASAEPVAFTAVFSRPVSGFTGSDVTLAGLASPTTAVVSEMAPNDGTTYRIEVSGTSADGLVAAAIAADRVVDVDGVANAASTSTDNEVTLVMASDWCTGGFTASAGSVSYLNRVCTVTGSVQSVGAVEVPLGQTLRMLDSMTFRGEVTNYGTVESDSGFTTATADIVNRGTWSLINAPSLTSMGANDFTNFGTLNLSGTLLSSGRLYNESGATVNVLDGGRIFPAGIVVPNLGRITAACSATLPHPIGNRVVEECDPVLTLPADRDVQADGPTGKAVTFTASAVDSGPIYEDGVDVLTVTCTPASGSVFPVGVTTVNCWTQDNAATRNRVDDSFTVTVTAPLSVTGPSPQVVVGEPTPDLTPVYSGFLPGDDTGDLTSAATCSTTRTASSPPGGYPVTCLGAAIPGFYHVRYVAGEITVSRAATSTAVTRDGGDLRATVSVTAPGAGTPTGTLEFTANGAPIGAAAVQPDGTAVLAVPADLPVGVTTVAGAYGGDESFAGSSGQTQFTVTTPLTVSAPSAAVVVGQATPDLAPSLTGLVGSDTGAVVTGTTCTTTRVPGSLPGVYPVTCSGASAPDYYVIGYTAGQITVARATTTTTVTVSGGTATATVTAVAPGAGNPDGTVAFTVNGAAAGTAALGGDGTAALGGDGTAALPLALPAGPVTVVASYAGSDSYTGSTGSTAKQDPTITATVTGAANRAGWYRVAPVVSFTCTPGSAPLTGPCPDPVTVGSGRGLEVQRAIAAMDGGAASVTVTGLNVDTTPPAVRVDGVESGQRFIGPPITAFMCEARDALSGPAPGCDVTTTRVKKATSPRFREVWRFRATGTDRAGNTTTVTGRYTVSALYLGGQAAQADGSVRVDVATQYTVRVATDGTAAPRYYYAVPAGPNRNARPTQAGPLMRKWSDGRWGITIGLRPVTAEVSRYWNIGIKIPGHSRLRIITLDLGRD